MLVGIMNNVGLNNKNIVNCVGIFNESVAMNSTPWNNTRMNNVSCEYYQDE